MGNSCLESIFGKSPDHLYEIHANPSDLLALPDGLDTLFTARPQQYAYDVKVLLVVGAEQTCCMGWIPATPLAFVHRNDRNMTMVSAVLKGNDSLDKANVLVVFHTAVVVPSSS
jgi:hypothetical protein